MTTIERALHVLIHDVRTPLGVAQGYLRLLHEGRLTSPDATARAITQAQQALDRISRLCDDAARLADRLGVHSTRRVEMPCGEFVERVLHQLTREAVIVEPVTVAGGRTLAVAADTDELVDAVARVLLAPTATGGSRPVAIGASTAELWFTSGMDAPALSGGELDCWRGGGFALPLACQTITGAGGRVWTAGRTGNGAGVALPIGGVR
ncbi:MAG: histidine kinase dimerization/phospho-acceptor domain-containing protein [Vicinamibacterales bacterium]